MNLQTSVGQFISLVRSVVRRAGNTGLARTAGSLAFTTVLGLVPLATVAFAFVARFPVFQQWLDALEGFLLKVHAPGSANEVVHRYVREFTEKAVQLTGLSVLFIAIAATLVIATVEREINAMWGISASGPMAQRLTVYLLGITVGPGARRRQHLGQHLARVADAGADRAGIHASRASPVELLPFVLSTLALALVYLITPNRRVPLYYAFAGALPAALAFEVAKYGFALYVKNVPTYEIVYGTLAALPVFLIWIYVCWLIVLGGAAITATLTLGSRYALARASGGHAQGSAQGSRSPSATAVAADECANTSATLESRRGRRLPNPSRHATLRAVFSPGASHRVVHRSGSGLADLAPDLRLGRRSCAHFRATLVAAAERRRAARARRPRAGGIPSERRDPRAHQSHRRAGTARPDPRHRARQREELARGDQGGDRGGGPRRHA
jgi:YihY family inner membrane protein